MVIPAQRLSDLESAAWQTEKRLDRIETHLVDLQDKADTLQQTANQHAIALSATMKDLRDLRIDVSQMAKVLDGHTATLASHTETLSSHTQTLASQSEILAGHSEILAGHSATLAHHTAMLTAIVKHFGIELPEPELV
jgi:predicted  nucleic acid-binding Zn-ribbon protein